MSPTRVIRDENATLEDLAASCREHAVSTLGRELFWMEGRPGVREVIVEALVTRSASIRREFVDVTFLDGVFGIGGDDRLDAALDLVRSGFAECEQPEYLRQMLHRAIGVPTSPYRGTREPVESEIRADRQRFLERELWAMFRVEGAGVAQLAPVMAAFLDLVADHPKLRGRLIDAALSGLLSDFSAHDVGWYLQVLRALDPDAAEVAARAARYLAVLAATPGVSVALAQQHLGVLARAETIPSGALTALAPMTAAVLARSDKKSRMAQLALVEKLASAHPREVDAAGLAELIAGADHGAADVAARASRVLSRLRPGPGSERHATSDAPTGVVGGSAPEGTSATVVVAGPRTTPRRTDSAPDPLLAAIEDPDELADLFVELLERPASGAELLRGVDAVIRFSGRSPLAADVLRRRIRDWNDQDGGGTAGLTPHLDPRAYLRAVVAAWVDEPTRLWRWGGFQGHFTIGGAAGVPSGLSYPSWSPRPAEEAPARAQPEQVSGYRRMTSPQQVFVDWIATSLAAMGPSGDRGRWLDTARADAAAAAARARWTRHERLEGDPEFMAGYHTPAGPTPPWIVWMDDAADPPREGDLAAGLFDLRPALRTFAGLGADARSSRDAVTLLDWLRIVLIDAPEHFAAHALPALTVAVDVPNVDTTPATDALRDARSPLGPPSRTALVLALSANEAIARARAAEAFDGCARSGMLDPIELGAELVRALELKRVKGARVASALADSARISALAGWRALQLLGAVLPHLSGVTGASALIELTAQLAERYGVVVPIPPALAARSRGSSITAIALRALAAVEPRPTELARQAAEQAEAALRD
ncbi:hypothetical protein GCM10027515_30300 [Schumannella luteola]|uniref:Uncharacterized protein n=1 Tax=Schumannella luteola TaxID=472059 RepID=A0A852YN71_9MICO|nr:DUF6493 family protein [Schumannella luteola]NYG99169.1 hypothetical protein [Schumannella luteola]TPX03701.1 hypothetical protein FJ656_15735 [Schumannella luteola]